MDPNLILGNNIIHCLYEAETRPQVYLQFKEGYELVGVYFNFNYSLWIHIIR